MASVTPQTKLSQNLGNGKGETSTVQSARRLTRRHFESKVAGELPRLRAGAKLSQRPGWPKVSTQTSTSALKALTAALSSKPASKSFNFLPLTFCTSSAIWQQRSRKAAIFLKSSAVQPRVVIAGAPMRAPPGDRAEASPGTQLRFKVMEHTSQTFSILEPVRPCGRTSHRMRWLSVPPLAKVWPFSTMARPNVAAFSTTFFE